MSTSTVQMTLDMLIDADVLPDGTGFRIVPRKPKLEISCREAMRILGVESPQSIVNIINSPIGSKMIRWRWKNLPGGHRLFDLESVQRYKAFRYETASS